MKTIRSIHLFFGCLFAPLIIFFSLSGLLQTFELQHDSNFLSLLSTAHTNKYLKSGKSLSSFPMKVAVASMAVGLVTTSLLGIWMAFAQTKKKRVVWACLAAGTFIPLGFAICAFYFS